jgi:aquaporin Z
VNDRDLWIAAVAEFFGPFALCVAGIGAIISTQVAPQDPTQVIPIGGNLVAVALAHGLAIGVMIAALGHVSGGHFNPAVSISMWLSGEISLTRAVAYIVAQLLGAVAGAGILTVVFPALGPLGRNNVGVNLGVPALGADITVAGGVIMEAVMSFFLVLVIFGSAVDPRGPKAIAPLAIGLTITMDILTGGRVTGAAMNPARAFGPAVIQQDFTNWWVYWVGPIVGGLVAAFAYKYIWLVRVPMAAIARRAAEAPAAPTPPPPPQQPQRRSSRRR